MKFEKEYTEYWAAAVQQSIDGTVIPSPALVDKLLKIIFLKKVNKILDLGCSFGRMFPVLSKHSEYIIGIDPDPYALQRASEFSYKELLVGTTEKTGLKDSDLDFVFCWAVFDVVNQSESLLEINRILQKGGRALITGKSTNYREDDDLAFKAEKNAFIKKFPNNFTDLKLLDENLVEFGFEIELFELFSQRGDFGLFNGELRESKIDTSASAYEFLLVCSKRSKPSKSISQISISSHLSSTAEGLAKKQGYSSAVELFEAIGLD